MQSPYSVFQEQSSRHANVAPGIDFPETAHNFLSNRPLGLITMILQVNMNMRNNHGNKPDCVDPC